MIPAPAAQTYLGLSGPALQLLLLILSMGSFSYIMWKRFGCPRSSAAFHRPVLENGVLRRLRLLKVSHVVRRQEVPGASMGFAHGRNGDKSRAPTE